MRFWPSSGGWNCASPQEPINEGIGLNDIHIFKRVPEINSRSNLRIDLLALQASFLPAAFKIVNSRGETSM